MAKVNTWTAFLFSVEKPLGLHPNPGTHVIVVCVESSVVKITHGVDEVKLVQMT